MAVTVLLQFNPYTFQNAILDMDIGKTLVIFLPWVYTEAKCNNYEYAVDSHANITLDWNIYHVINNYIRIFKYNVSAFLWKWFASNKIYQCCN